MQPGTAQLERQTTVAAAGTRSARLPELLWVLATALVSIAVLTADLKLWKMDVRVPIFPIDGDGSYYLASIKGVLEHGWFWQNPDLGAPFGQENFDFAAPFGDVAHYAIVSLLGLVLGATRSSSSTPSSCCASRSSP